MLTLIRCDDRLIHGQCMTVIVKAYDIEEIIVVDNFTATNSVLKTVFRTAVPPHMKADAWRRRSPPPSPGRRCRAAYPACPEWCR